MAIFNVLTLILFGFTFAKVSGLSCLSCKGTMQPRHCHTVEKCQTGQYCAVERYFDQFNDVYYDLLCKDISTCPINNITSHSNCVECCQSDLCNAKGCGTPGFPQGIGPLCYSCKSLIRGRQCHMIDICDKNEVCFVDETEELGDILIDSGCRTNSNCFIRNNQDHGVGSIIGKRSLTERSVSHPFCTNCCETNLCNGNCSVGSQSGTATSTTTMTSPSTTTSTTKTTSTTASTTTSSSTTTPPPTGYDCLDIHTRMPHAPSGPYNITIGGSRSLMVWCDMTTSAGGWTVFQKRFNGSVDFYQNFAAYRDGFGSVHGEFWLGLENLHQLTVGHSNTLRVDTIHYNGTHLHDTIPSFNVGPGVQYILHVADNINKTASREMLYFDGQSFSTKDANREAISGNCAVRFHSAFWYGSGCFYYANPNGPYGPGQYVGQYSMTYFDGYGNRAIEMKFRRVV